MKRLRAEIEESCRRTRTLAETWCDLVDSTALNRLTPLQFRELQTGLRSTLLQIDRRLREIRPRQPRRSLRLARCRGKPGFGTLLQSLNETLQERDDALVWERRVLKQV